ncbi:MAG TPA: hypothetical protein VEQ60_02350, partial [Longimicrobium sp.]|nr:hypothetical protein [Longimicrobium sp.]
MASDRETTGGDAGGPGGMVLFALPFALAGVWGAANAVRAYREGAREEALSVGIFALAFCGVGFGLMIGSLYGARKAARARKARRPGRPWPGRQRNQVGRIDSSETQGLRAVWAAALGWNLFLSPFYFGLADGLRSGSRAALAGLILPLVGIVLIIAALRARRRWRRFGKSTLQMAEALPAIGGRLVGRIISDRLPADAASIRLRLTCLRREKGRYGAERLVWETEKTLPASPARSTGAIPVEFDIPAHCEPTSEPRSSSSYIQWVLQATAEAPGVDFAPRFEVPVY